MNKIELNKEFEKYREITDSIIETEYLLGCFMYSDGKTKTSVENLKFICLKRDLFEAEVLENLNNEDEDDIFEIKANIIEFCAKLKDDINNDFINKISENGNNLKLRKKFDNFYEIYEHVVSTEFCLNVFVNFPEFWDEYLNKLKFICLKQNLCEIDVLDNLSNLDNNELLEFCSELKENICNDFINQISTE